MNTETTAPAGAQPCADNRAAIEHQARALIARAAQVGYHVAIEPRPLQPLAMRNYELQVTVWPIR